MSTDNSTYRPEWQPEGAGSEFACFVAKGIDQVARPTARATKRARMSVDDYAAGILAGDRVTLSRAITLIESNAPKHFDMAQELIQKLLPYTGHSMRIGITGVPERERAPSSRHSAPCCAIRGTKWLSSPSIPAVLSRRAAS